ncbi:MAG TPA: M20/M25/M40 family metallo-hydrolase, partial [Bacillota bacterium]|nr:M20/M25/M40 family metallo-hydrolase [Bacillota bacterium]
MEEQYLKLLEEMVNIDSGTGDIEGLTRVGAIIQRRSGILGYTFEILVGPDGSKHYYLSRGQGKRVLLVAHIDTVFSAGTAKERPFTIDGDVARGPGVSDCKSGVVTILAALEHYHRTSDSTAAIGCLFNCDEEIGSPGSRRIIENLAREAQAVFVVEPAEGETITVARKGIGRFRLEAFGKAAHSGSDFTDGHSAVLELAHKIIAVQALTDLEAGITLNTGVIRGGTKSNIVPDYAVADIDLRIRAAGQE